MFLKSRVYERIGVSKITCNEEAILFHQTLSSRYILLEFNICEAGLKTHKQHNIEQLELTHFHDLLLKRYIFMIQNSLLMIK